MQKFGLGKATGISITGEAKGILMNKSLVKRVDLARMGFGHAVALTPIQLAMAVSSITNGGNLLQPYLVSQRTSPDGQVQVLSSTQTKGKVCSYETSQKVNTLLEKATNKLEPYTFVEGYNVGGKTGTAQKYKQGGGIDQGKYISSFLGSYPANDPEYILLLLVDEPGAGAYYGSVVAAPYGKEVFSGIFEYLSIEKDSSDPVEYVTMPSLVGISLTDASVILKQLGLFYELDGEGEYILQQLPPQGTSLAKGTTIVLIT